MNGAFGALYGSRLLKIVQMLSAIPQSRPGAEVMNSGENRLCTPTSAYLLRKSILDLSAWHVFEGMQMMRHGLGFIQCGCLPTLVAWGLAEL